MVSIIILLLLLIALTIMIGRTIALREKRYPSESTISSKPPLEQTAQRLSSIITFPTVSHKNPEETNWNIFTQQAQWIEETYPLIHNRLSKQTFKEHSMLFTWNPPTQSSNNPILLMAHLDVVDGGISDEWKYPPFSGTIEENRVWGRGSLDIKFQVITILDTVEHLLSQGFIPNRTVYIAFGHDEEVLGTGAPTMAEWFRNQGIHFDLIHDEGGAVTSGVISTIQGEQATVGICEKGCANIELRASASGGHASMPPKQNSLNLIAQAIYEIEKHPLPPRLTPVTRQTFISCSPRMTKPLRFIMANLWLFKGILLKNLSKNPTTNALVRTTFTPVIAKAGDGENVIPLHSMAHINARLLPGDTCEKAVAHLKKVVPKGVSVHLKQGIDPSPISSIDTEIYERFATTVQQVFPEAIIAPYLMVGGTDAKYYADLSDHVLRFSPYLLNSEELGSMHNNNESVSFTNIERGVQFYLQLIHNFCGSNL